MILRKATHKVTASIQYLGHSAFRITTGDKTLLLDPFLTGNDQTPVTAEELTPDVILLSHGHEDHVGDTIAIAQRTGAMVIANFEIATWLNGQGVANTHPMHIGGQHAFDFGSVKLTIAHHGSVLPDGTYGGNPCGIILKLPDSTIYFAGDTGLFYDMNLIGEVGIDTAILPIGDNFTMGPDDSLRAIQFLKPKHVIPCHFDTWPLIAQGTTVWSQRVRAETTAIPVVLKPGESFPSA